MINPLTFYWHDGMSLDTPSRHQLSRDEKYYSGSMRQLEKWKKLIRGEAEVRYIIRFVALNSLRRARQTVLTLLDRLRLIPRSRLGRDLTTLTKLRRNLTMFFSDSDPGHSILIAEGRDSPRWMEKRGFLSIEFITRADHTFSEQSARGRLIEAVVGRLKRRYA
jgi:hypothetical protein